MSTEQVESKHPFPKFSLQKLYRDEGKLNLADLETVHYCSSVGNVQTDTYLHFAFIISVSPCAQLGAELAWKFRRCSFHGSII